MSGVDLKQINRNDQLVLAGGLAAFIFSFFPFWGFTFNASYTAWHSFGFLGVLLILIAAAAAAARVFADTKLPALPIGPNLAESALAAIGTLLLIIRGFTYDSFGTSAGVMWGGYLVFLAGIVVVVSAVMNAREAGEKFAWDPSALNRPAAPSTPMPGQPVGYQPPAPEQPSAPEENTPTL